MTKKAGKSDVSVDEETPTKEPSVSMDWVQMLWTSAAGIGLTPEKLAEMVGVSEPTLRRLRTKGESRKSALSFRAKLVELGASNVPPGFGEGVVEDPIRTPEWMREWISLGEKLHEVATPEEFAAMLKKVRNVIDATNTLRKELGEVSRIT